MFWDLLKVTAYIVIGIPAFCLAGVAFGAVGAGLLASMAELGLRVFGVYSGIPFFSTLPLWAVILAIPGFSVLTAIMVIVGNFIHDWMES